MTEIMTTREPIVTVVLIMAQQVDDSQADAMKVYSLYYTLMFLEDSSQYKFCRGEGSPKAMCHLGNTKL